jgi:membrane-associated phospholipid phosphatase
MIERFFQLVTHFGDSALLIPLSLATIVTLVWGGHRPAAWRFAVAVACLMAATVVLKIGFYAIGGDAALDVLSPSGHAGFSVTVYGCCGAILAKQCRVTGAVLVVTATTLLLATVLASRIILGVHTPAEVVIGSALGLLCIAVFLLRNPDMAQLRLRVPVPLLVILVAGSLSVWVEARQFNTERRIERVGVLVGAKLGTLLPSDLVPGHADKVRRLTE